MIRGKLTGKVVAVLVALCALQMVWAAAASASPYFSATGSMPGAYSAITGSPLPDGRSLVTGPFSTIYNPATGTFGPAASMLVPRYTAASAPLGNGKVLVAGGGNTPAVQASAELYDVATDSFAAANSMSVPRAWPVASPLPDGRVLVAGGKNGPAYLDSAEIYDPVGDSFSPTGSMSVGRFGAAAALLSDGRVLVTGGETITGRVGSAEIYDPSTGTFSPTGSMATPRYHHMASPLPDGRVLIAGGEDINLIYLRSAEIYDPVNGDFEPTTSLQTPRASAASSPIPGGRVLLAGGSSGSTLSSAVLFNNEPTPRASGGSFGDQPVGTTSAVRQVRITNLGSQILRIGGAAHIEGDDAADFEIRSDGCAGRSLGFREFCVVAVSFAPSGLGGRIADLVIQANTDPVENLFCLCGEGVEAPAGPTGPTGVTGSSGGTGTNGPTGSEGPSGPTGPSGGTGATGTEGATGPAGPAGNVILPVKPKVTQTVRRRQLGRGRSFVFARIRCSRACRVNRATGTIRAGIGKKAKVKVHVPKRLPAGGSVTAKLSIPAGVAKRLKGSGRRSRIAVTIVATSDGGRTTKSMVVMVRAR